MSLGKCSIRGCGREAGVLYPLLAGSPAFCREHHNSRDAGRFGCDLGDNFDPPMEDMDSEREYGFEEPLLTRRGFIWVDIDGDEHRLSDIDDRYLGNIIGYLKRKTLEGLEGAERTIKFLERESRRRLDRKGGA